MADSKTTICQNCKRNFAIEPDDFSFYEKIQVPPPTFCWLCRAQRRLAWRNERALYKRKSNATGREIFSAFPPEAPHTVYENDIWYSDQWDGITYGRDYDFSRPFFEQFNDLHIQVPQFALSVVSPVNSDYGNNLTDAKNCYLIFNCTHMEDCLYGNGTVMSKECIDFSHLSKCELCYESFWLTRCQRTFFSDCCEDCTDVWFSRDLRNCSNCFGCVGLRNASYQWFNEGLQKDEYGRRFRAFHSGSYAEVERHRAQALDRWSRFPVKYIEGAKNTDVSGNYIFNSKNVKNSFLVREGENIKFSQYLQVPPNKDCYDHSTWGDGNELTYEVCQAGLGTYNIRFCVLTYPNVKNLEYCIMCQSSSDLFGCVGLRKKQYCVLNKQYPKEEYEALVSKIRQHMMEVPYTDRKGRVYRYGEFFPVEQSPYPYNETPAQDYFTLTKEQALEVGFAWRDQPTRERIPTETEATLPDDIGEVSDDILSEIVECAHRGKCNDNCTGAFRIVPAELAFHRRMRVPLPRLCPNCRTRSRLGGGTRKEKLKNKAPRKRGPCYTQK